ncbi:hypothetical protein COT78_01215 [Candidatus Berkelbacteria bacterium CG10_big_fil_rev_8_21_14_0_10_43_13]|uniref:Uncharacterized protein n=1 Tax=Candidatus Berkelbacteria bacterium CG10_big_fil_rev_8_21_14_0_10_43_13 TaxID=1974514 RepID=A0A2H0W6Z0_9BACT|nr:MAG: hypothetical protein COT78_01215 [Candidatus Berkelbacteria bacterium CG10_big_fil_rev_8_21_14_0_10_43_13]
MGKNTKSRMLGIIGSSLLLVVTVAGFFWFWSSAQSEVAIDTSADQKYQTIEVSNLASTAKSLISDKTNAGDLPVQPPTSDQVGRDNPFASN